MQATLIALVPPALFFLTKWGQKPDKKKATLMRRAKSVIKAMEVHLDTDESAPITATPKGSALASSDSSSLLAPPEPDPDPQDAVRAAIIGTGWGLRVQLPQFRNAGLHVVAVYSRDPKKAAQIAREQRVPLAFTDVKALINCPHADIVSVCSPPFLHAAQVIETLRAGKHVICDKPMALNASEAESMVRAFEEASRLDRAAAVQKAAEPGSESPGWSTVTTAHNSREGQLVGLMDHELRFTEAWLRARRHIREGKIGDVLYVDANIFQPPARTTWTWWSDEKQGGGVLFAIGSHILDSLRYLLGAELTEMACTLSTQVPQLPEETMNGPRLKDVTSDDWCSMSVKCSIPGEDGGAAPRVVDARITTAFSGTEALLRVKGFRQIKVVGTEGLIVLDIYDASLQAFDENGQLFDEVCGGGNAFSAVGTPALARAIRAALSTASPERRAAALEPAATLWDGLAVQYAMDCAKESSRAGGAWVKIPSTEAFRERLTSELASVAESGEDAGGRTPQSKARGPGEEEEEGKGSDKE